MTEFSLGVAASDLEVLDEWHPLGPLIFICEGLQALGEHGQAHAEGEHAFEHEEVPGVFRGVNVMVETNSVYLVHPPGFAEQFKLLFFSSHFVPGVGVPEHRVAFHDADPFFVLFVVSLASV